MEILSAFIVGFVTMWIVNRIDYTKSSNPIMKNNMIEVANIFCKNDKICREIKNYSFDKIKNGSFEYIEVIETLKQNKNDKI